jgi:Skp family chaperone for outer membrane proteins
MLSHKDTEFRRAQALLAKTQEELDALSAKLDNERLLAQEELKAALIEQA